MSEKAGIVWDDKYNTYVMKCGKKIYPLDYRQVDDSSVKPPENKKLGDK